MFLNSHFEFQIIYLIYSIIVETGGNIDYIAISNTIQNDLNIWVCVYSNLVIILLLLLNLLLHRRSLSLSESH